MIRRYLVLLVCTWGCSTKLEPLFQTEESLDGAIPDARDGDQDAETPDGNSPDGDVPCLCPAEATCSLTLAGRRCVCRPGTVLVGNFCEPVVGQAVLRVATGGISTCAVLLDQTVRCWGEGFGAAPGTAIAIPGSSILDIEAGGDFYCARNAEREVYCWGKNDRGQLGVPSPSVSSEPVRVGDGAERRFDALTVGGEFACGLDQGTVWCWGANDGRLGDGTTVDRSSPTRVSELSGVDTVGVGEATACAANLDGSVWCWGDNSFGQVGDGTVDAVGLVPVFVGNIGADQVSAGVTLSCASTTTDFLCWGDLRAGYFGQPQIVPDPLNSVPRSLPHAWVSPIVDMTLEVNRACVLGGEHAVWCWGEDLNGSLGLGLDQSGAPQTVATPTVLTLSDDAIATSVSCSPLHCCLVTAAGGIRCWGENSSGQLGDGTNVNRNIPTQVLGTVQR